MDRQSFINFYKHYLKNPFDRKANEQFLRKYVEDFGNKEQKENVEILLKFIRSLVDHLPYVDYAIKEYLSKFSVVEIIAPANVNGIIREQIITVY